VDEWAGRAGRLDVLAQTGGGTYRPKHIKAVDRLDPAEFDRLQRSADVIIAHCGTGSMFAALTNGQPIIMLPRRSALGEHRNDHQWATAQHFRELPGVYVAEDEHQLASLLDRAESLGAAEQMSDKAPPEFARGLEALLVKLSSRTGELPET
jgi:UDP-N-acetylglucosamine transferase subunit ALG13